MKYTFIPLLTLLPFSISFRYANDQDNSDYKKTDTALEVKRDDIYITGGAAEIKKQPGSAHLIDSKDIEKFEYDDINRVLSDVPGVNIQEEEGYGLRPNIGLRGAHPHRSRKVLLMEDAVLIGPAPYSAPAAYYFPMFAKMEGIEVFKGPSSIKYGPNTVGGAINMVTRSIPEKDQGRLNVAYGTDNYTKAHAYYGQRSDFGGWLIDGINLQSDGFKELDTGGDTGFSKSDITLKGMLNSPIHADIYQQLDVKIQYSDEDSDSTYTGLSEDDFKRNPYRRYAATERDYMDAKHKQLMLSHYIEFSPTISLTSTMYRNEFERLWSKLNGFDSSTTLNEIFDNPSQGSNADFLQVLRGDVNSVDLGADGTLIIGNNDREYMSQGIQFVANWDPMLWGIGHELEFGFRYHQDYIERNHTTDSFLMTNGTLVSDGSPRLASTTNKDSSDAISLHIHDKIEIDKWTFTGGLRAEFIETTREDRSGANTADIENEDTVVIPGFGVYYQLNDELGLLAGVNKGFSPVGPGQDDNIKPEESINYEAGFRYYKGTFSTELIGFYNDYSNIKGVCTFSSGCDAADIDKEFNGGEAEVKGLELTFGYSWQYQTATIPFKLNYTFTDAVFANNFSSENPDWGIGDINSGDPLPYIPEHQASASVGIVNDAWATHAIVKYVDNRYDMATDTSREIPNYSVVDFKASYQVTKDLQLHASLKNVFDEVYLTSLRPYGNRPGIPRQALVGLKLNF